MVLSFHYQMQAEASVISIFPAECPRGAPQSEFNLEQQDKNIRDKYEQLEQELLYRERRQWEWVSADEYEQHQSTAAEIQVQELLTV